MAMIGGGTGAFIGPVHRRAAALDGALVLVAGCFSRDPLRNRETGAAVGVDLDRIYPDYEALIVGEAARSPDERAEFISIVTPNYLHAPIALAALAHGFPVLCEKPLARGLGEAREIAKAAGEAGVPFGITYTYLGYALVHEARALVASGRIGSIRRVSATYTQGWLAGPEEANGNVQAVWRTDPASAGTAGAVGDIGVHAQSLIEFVCGCEIASVSGDIRAAVPGRRLDDDGAVLLRFEGGARGSIVVSQICSGDENRLELRVYGETGSIEWSQETPHELWVRPLDRPAQRISANPSMLSDPVARGMLRLPGGHPEGYIEAFANLYLVFAARVRGRDTANVPGVEAGVRSMAFVEAVVASSAADGAWRTLGAEK